MHSYIYTNMFTYVCVYVDCMLHVFGVSLSELELCRNMPDMLIHVKPRLRYCRQKRPHMQKRAMPALRRKHEKTKNKMARSFHIHRGLYVYELCEFLCLLL